MAAKSTLFQQAQKEIRRLKRATKRAEKRGYIFDLPFGRTKSGAEKTRYTQKEVEKLSQLHLKDLYKYSKYGSEKAGYVSGEEARKSEAKWQAQQASRARWEKYREKIRIREKIEHERFMRDLYEDTSYKSISRTIIDNCMDRKNWRYTDKYYERFNELVKRRMSETSINEVAEVFQKMLNEGVLSQIQRHYKPEDFFIDIETFQEYFNEMIPEENDEMLEEENEEFEDYEGDDFEEIFG